LIYLITVHERNRQTNGRTGLLWQYCALY